MYALKCGKTYWCPSNNTFSEGWAYMTGDLATACIYITTDKKDAREKCKMLRRKNCKYRTIMVEEIKNPVKLSALTIARLKYDNQIRH